MFGRPGQGISLNYGQSQTAGVHVVCVNPASIGGGTGELASSFPLAAVQPLPAQMLPAPAVSTPWVTYPDMYRASCESSGGATWLQITHNAPAGDVRPLPAEPLGPTSTASTCPWATSSTTCVARRPPTVVDLLYGAGQAGIAAARGYRPNQLIAAWRARREELRHLLCPRGCHVPCERSGGIPGDVDDGGFDGLDLPSQREPLRLDGWLSLFASSIWGSRGDTVVAVCGTQTNVASSAMGDRKVRKRPRLD